MHSAHVVYTTEVNRCSGIRPDTPGPAGSARRRSAVDGYDPGPPPTLLDAKGNYATLLDSTFAGGTVRQNFVDEAFRQVQAADGHAITWVCAEPETAAEIRSLFDQNGLGGVIDVVVRAPK